MSTTNLTAISLAMALAAFSVSAAAAEEATPSGAAAEQVNDMPDGAQAELPNEGGTVTLPVQPRSPRLIYKPPKPGKPARTVGGGSRGSSDRIPKLFAVTPEHVGLTVSERPSLFWFLDRVPEAVQVEFALLDEDSIEPLLETTLAAPERAGIQRIRLTDYGVALAAGREYEWSVTLILDPDKRSRDVMATGWIDRIEPSGQLTRRLENGDPAATAAVYADEGLWYDSFAALSDQIDRNPGDEILQHQRADVLRQVGLDEAADGADG